jgi:hypothetical protein
MLNNYKEYKNIKMPEDMKMNILESMQKAKPKKKLRSKQKRRVSVIAAMFVCFAMIASAVYFNIPSNYMENIGLFASDTDENGENGSIFNFDSVKRVNYDRNFSQLSVVVAGGIDPNIRIITNDNDVEIEPDFIVPDENDGDYAYYFNDFPKVDDFTLVNGEETVEIILPVFNYIGFGGTVQNDDGNPEPYDVILDEFYITPKVLDINETTRVDSVNRAKFGNIFDEGVKSMSGSLYVTLVGVTDPDSVKIITKDYGEFEPDLVFNKNWAKSYSYQFYHFPEINEFTLVHGNDSIEIELVLFKDGGYFDPSQFKLTDHYEE